MTTGDDRNRKPDPVAQRVGVWIGRIIACGLAAAVLVLVVAGLAWLVGTLFG